MLGLTPGRLLLVALVAAAVYAGALRHEFVFDDHQIIEDNPVVTGQGRLGEIATSHYWHPLRPRGYLYRPLTILSFRIDHWLGGGSPAVFHATNIVLHVVVSVLVALCLATFLGGASPGPAAARAAFLTGLLFASHPVHSEAVAGIAGRGDLLAALLAAGAWLLHMRGRAWAAGAALLTSLLCKESAVSLPALLVLSDWLGGERPPAGRRLACAARRYGPALGALAVYLILRAALLDAPAGGDVSLIHPIDNPVAAAPFMTRAATAMKVLGLEAMLLVFPWRLSADYSYNQISAAGPGDPAALAGLALAAGGIALAWAFRHRRFGPALPVLFTLAAIAPVSNIPVPIGTIMAERLLYWPSIGACAGLALLALWAAARAPSDRSGPAALAIGLVLAGLFAARTIAQVPAWRNDRALFESAAASAPASAKAAYNLGMVHLKAGDAASALPWLERAVDNARGLPQVGRLADMMRDLATALDAVGRRDEAISWLKRAQQAAPRHVGVLINLGNMLATRGDAAGALASYGEALEIDPNHAGALLNRARLLLRAGRPGDAAQAARDLENAARSAPGLTEALYFLGEAYLAEGRHADAASTLRAFLDRAAPGQESLARAARQRLRQLGEE
ncbi:MAG: tetratricopeptide repeat protein [Candidatus Polarisedimenticolia bacterium]